jgi:hypothetical protein
LLTTTEEQIERQVSEVVGTIFEVHVIFNSY